MTISVKKYFQFRKEWIELYQKNDIENIKKSDAEEMLAIDDELSDFEERYKIITTRFKIKTGSREAVAPASENFSFFP